MMANGIVFQQRAADLAEMITRVIREGLEGLVLKDLKVQPDYVPNVIQAYCKLHSMLPLKALEMVCYNLHVVRLKATPRQICSRLFHSHGKFAYSAQYTCCKNSIRARH